MSEILDDINMGYSNDRVEIWDNSKRAKNVIIVFCVLIGLTIVGLFTGYNELQILKKVQIGEFVSEQEAEMSDLLQAVIGFAQMGIYIVSVILFLNWFRRAYGNLHRLGISDLKYSETMTIWAWFIPIISLFRPVQIMNEIWNETQKKIKELDASYTFKDLGLPVTLWWILFIISTFIGRHGMKKAFKDETIEHLIDGTQAFLISDIMEIPEALLVVLIVFKISKMESKLAKELRSESV